MWLIIISSKKILWQTNCGNAIAEIGEIFFWQLWQCHCQKWEGKKKLWLPKSGEKLKKKKKCYVHNIFTTFSQQITGD